ncbi:hypothetical protein B296_00020202 [Ensete ventricosum]|uniref:Uncharacterized protein n=1 Tax=Ensete ventricosum TaxID=4639 RepID=A0A427AP64_ENSVE|nr:hypothetical protein B296_00020202 [Ensete ventricosum]
MRQQADRGPFSGPGRNFHVHVTLQMTPPLRRGNRWLWAPPGSRRVDDAVARSTRHLLFAYTFIIMAEDNGITGTNLLADSVTTLMAAAESRPAQQHIASLCLVHEDSEGTRRLACCPSSTSVNILGYENTAIAQDYNFPEFMPSNGNPMNPNLSPETKGRLQLPIVGCPKDFTCEQLSSIDREADGKYTETAVPTSELDGMSLPVDFIKFVLKREDMVSTASMKSGSGTRFKEMNSTTIYSQQSLKQKANMDFVYKVEELLDLKPVDQLALRNSEKAFSYLETHWAGCNKPETWWRIADKDDLALLVAQKSLQHIENCDLPKPTRTVHYMKDLFSSIENLDASEIFQSSFGVCNANEYSHDSSSTGRSDDMNSGERGCLLHDSEKLYRQATVHLLLCFISLQVLVVVSSHCTVSYLYSS